MNYSIFIKKIAYKIHIFLLETICLKSKIKNLISVSNFHFFKSAKFSPTSIFLTFIGLIVEMRFASQNVEHLAVASEKNLKELSLVNVHFC